MTFPEHALAHQLLDGLSGLEIGAAAHNPFGLKTRNVAPPDDFEFYAGAQAKMGTAASKVDIWATADAIPLPNDSEDFVLSSHVVEHLPNVVATFIEWNRVVRVGGLIFMIVPLRNALPDDQERPITPLADFIEDYHLRRDLASHPTERVPGGRMGHYHVFSPNRLLELVGWMNAQRLCNWELIAREDVDTKVGNGFTLAFRVLSLSPTRSEPESGRMRLSAPQVDSLALDDLRNIVAQHARDLAAEWERSSGTEIALREKDEMIRELQRMIHSDRDNLGEWLLRAGRSVRDRLCPRDSVRWRLYQGLSAPLRRLLRPRTLGAVRRLLNRFRCNSHGELSRSELKRMRERSDDFAYRPLISTITPVYDVDENWLRETIESVQRQAYPNWELCLVNDASTAPHIRAVLDEYAARDARIRVRHLEKNEGIAGASNRALELASGDYAVLLDHDDLLASHAFFEIVQCLNEDRSLDMIYSDEDKIGTAGQCYDPVLKPAWNPSLLLACNYVSHLGAYRLSLLRAIGGFRSEFDGSQDYDLVLRFTERTNRVGHIPKVLYHWRAIETSAASGAGVKPYAYIAARRAIEEAMSRRGQPSRVEMRSPGQYRVHPLVSARTTVSLVVSWSQHSAANEKSLRKLLRQSADSPATEVLLVVPENKKVLPADLARQVRVLPARRQEPIGTTLNRAVRRARGEHLLFIDAGVQPLQDDWLTALLEQMQDHVGVVGARILGADGRLIHSGLVLNADGTTRSSSAFVSQPGMNQFLYADSLRNCSAVGNGCLLVRRHAFESAGGFDEHYELSHHDSDLCLRLREASWEIVYTPWAIFQQTHALKQHPAQPKADERLFHDRWSDKIPKRDPFFHPELARKSAARSTRI